MSGIFDSGIFDSGIFDSGTSFPANAVLKATVSSSFTADAVLVNGFIAKAVLKKNLSSSFTANARIKSTSLIANIAATLYDSGETGQLSSPQSIPVTGDGPSPGVVVAASWADQHGGGLNTNSGTVASPWTQLPVPTSGGTHEAFVSGYDADLAPPAFVFSWTPVAAFLRTLAISIPTPATAPIQSAFTDPISGVTTWGATPQAGSLLVAFVYFVSAGGPSIPSGWTEITLGSINHTQTNEAFGIFLRVAGASEPTTIGASTHRFLSVSEWSTPTTVAGSFKVDAIIRRNSFTIDAVLEQTNQFAFSARAAIKRTTTTSLTVDSFIGKIFRVDAVIKVTRTGTFTASAIIAPPHLTVDAVLAQRTYSFATIDAVIHKAGGPFSARAVIALHRTVSSFTASAWVKGQGTGSFTVSYMTRQPSGPPVVIGVPTKIFVNGIDVTAHVIWKTAEFTAKVNAATGECTLDILDRDHTMDFIFGDEITLFIDGVLRWGGWVIQAVRDFPFPVVANPTTKPRTWHIAGVDYNRFLDRRILHDSSSPGRSWNYPAGTYDNTILNDIWNYFDTTGFTKDFHRVNVGVLDIPGVTSKSGGEVASGGFSLRDVLQHISWDTAAIFYVKPTKVVTYLDSETLTSPYVLTDTPSGPLDVGYRDTRIAEDSTSMVNDAIVWGAGKGAANVVESRYQSSSSEAAHGRWQAGNFTAGIYKQATANAVAEAQVEGSPAAHRGAKNPLRSFEVTTFNPVFGVGDVVAVHNSSFAYDDVLPIRTMKVRWPTPLYPAFDLRLSWEVDAAWSFFDPWLPAGGTVPGGGGGPTGTTGLVCDCGTTDPFDRVLSVGWGQSEAGPFWSTTYNSITSVDGSQGILTATGTPSLVHDLPDFADVTAALTLFRNGTGFTLNGLLIENEPVSGSSIGIEVIKNDADTRMLIAWYYDYEYGGTEFQNGQFYLTGSSNGSKVWLRMSANGLDFKVKAWLDGDPEPVSWNVELTTTLANNIVGGGARLDVQGGLSALPGSTLKIDGLNIVDVNRCTAVQFDSFNRVNSPGLGLADNGFTWGYATLAGYATPHTDGNNAVCTFDGTHGSWDSYYDLITGIPAQLLQNQFVMTSRFIQSTTVTSSDVFSFDWSGLLKLTVEPVDAGLVELQTATADMTAPIYINTPSPCAGMTPYPDTGSQFYPPLNFPPTTPADGVIYYQKPGIALPSVPTPGFAGQFNFPIWGAGGTPDYPGMGVGNSVRCMVVGVGTATVLTSTYLGQGGGNPGAQPVAALVRNPAGIVTQFEQVTTPAPMSFFIDSSDGYCIHYVDVFEGSPAPDPGQWGFAGFEWSDLYQPKVIQTNSWYRIKLDFSRGEHIRVKVWAEADGEPANWLIDMPDVDNTDLSTTTLWSWVQSMVSPQPRTRLFDFIEFDYPGKPCYVVAGVGIPPSKVISVPPGSSLTETLTPLGTASGAPPVYPSGSEWQATNAIIPGSALLMLSSSYYQFGNWVVVDPAAGIIRIDRTVDATASVVLTYVTNGAIT